VTPVSVHSNHLLPQGQNVPGGGTLPHPRETVKPRPVTKYSAKTKIDCCPYPSAHLLPRPTPNVPAAAPPQRRARRPNPFTDGVPSLVSCRYRLHQRRLQHPTRTSSTGSTPPRLPPLSANDSTTSSSARVLGIGQLAPIRSSLQSHYGVPQRYN
jgi:hypothetical protein